MAGYQGDEPSNEFIEFVQVWNRREPYPEAIILFESSSGEFVVQVGYKIDEERTHNARILTLVTSAGSVVEIKRKKKGTIERRYKLLESSEHRIKATRTYLADT
ncbi:uncharacterized protein [Porites lutea]|uniref:uncharacterized protein n=1 Tax=Porites lutea TaxID=51062 RepID=UPI003CC52DCF